MSHSTKSVLHGLLMTLVAIGCGRDARMKPSLGFMKDEQTAGNSSFWILLLLVFEKCSSSIIYVGECACLQAQCPFSRKLKRPVKVKVVLKFSRKLI